MKDRSGWAGAKVCTLFHQFLLSLTERNLKELTKGLHCLCIEWKGDAPYEAGPALSSFPNVGSGLYKYQGLCQLAQTCTNVKSRKPSY
ncbi:hypothetical protein FRX31_025648 [Thalictrum thalictroides]|uniref:Uncharacterized protein n=1 Tax=Thalictrum thalictroides TaxID=46969 RepID=A0A7J6VI33_THATH|nr:hypothetical protein FRX31_025648 [Thalictrum thalictroides]